MIMKALLSGSAQACQAKSLQLGLMLVPAEALETESELKGSSSYGWVQLSPAMLCLIHRYCHHVHALAKPESGQIVLALCSQMTKPRCRLLIGC